MSNPNELVVNPQNADAAANEKVYIADLLVEQHDPEQVRACFAALDGDDLLRNVNNLKHARETMAWHMLLYLNRTSFDPGGVERIVEIHEREIRLCRTKVKKIIRHFDSIQELAKGLLHTREAFNEPERLISGEFTHMARSILESSSRFSQSLKQKLAHVKSSWSKRGGHSKMSEQLFLSWLVYDLVTYCGITPYEASKRLAWFLPKWPGWRQGVENKKRKISAKRIQQCYTLRKENE